MSKFIFRALFFIGILVVFKLLQTAFVFGNLNAKSASSFHGVQTGKPKIILVGSSNLDFNYDYKVLNQTYKEYDVIGCNLNEPSGLYATLHKLKKLQPKKGDVVILALPHSLYEPAKLIPLGGKGKIGFTPAMLKEGFKEFPSKFIEAIINIKTSDSYKMLGATNEAALKSDSIQFSPTTEADELADFLNCIKLNGEFNITSTGLDKAYLNEIHSYLNEAFEATILFRYPVVKDSEFVIDQKRLHFLNSNFEFINTFDNSIYKDEYWYNQWYHLNDCGRELNTKKLIGELNIHLNQ